MFILTHEKSAESPTPTPIQKRGDPLEKYEKVTKHININVEETKRLVDSRKRKNLRLKKNNVKSSFN